MPTDPSQGYSADLDEARAEIRSLESQLSVLESKHERVCSERDLFEQEVSELKAQNAKFQKMMKEICSIIDRGCQ